MLEEKC